MRTGHQRAMAMMGQVGRRSPTTEYFWREITKKKPRELKIVENLIPVLHPNPDFLANDYIPIDFSEPCTVLVDAPKGSGKTYFVRGLLGQLHEMGYKVVHLCSIKDDLYWSKSPVQEKFHKFLPPWRQPKALPIVPFVPHYLRTKQKHYKLKKGMQVGKIAFKDIEVTDLIKSAFGLTETETQAIILNQVWHPKNPPKNSKELIWRIDNVETLIRERVGMDVKFEFSRNSLNALRGRVLALINDEVFGDEGSMDFVGEINKGNIPSLNFNGSREPMNYHALYISALIRRLWRAKISGEIPKSERMVIVLEDSGTLAIPRNKEPSCKDLIISDLLSLGREYNIYLIFVTQTLMQIPDPIIYQADHIVFFGKTAGPDLDQIAKIRNVRPGELRKHLFGGWDPISHTYKKSMQPREYENGVRSCIIWSSTGSGLKGKVSYGFIPAPSSYHHEAN